MSKNLRIMGIDASYSCTGVVIYLGGNRVITQTLRAKMEDYRSVRRLVADIVTLAIGNEVKYIGMEDYAFGIAGKSRSTFHLGELGGAIKSALNRRGFRIHLISPTTLKKFVIGKGSGTGTKKEDVKLHTYKKWKFEHPSNDVVDAYVIARLIEAVKLNPTKLNQQLYKKIRVVR